MVFHKIWRPFSVAISINTTAGSSRKLLFVFSCVPSPGFKDKRSLKVDDLLFFSLAVHVNE